MIYRNSKLPQTPVSSHIRGTGTRTRLPAKLRTIDQAADLFKVDTHGARAHFQRTFRAIFFKSLSAFSPLKFKRPAAAIAPPVTRFTSYVMMEKMARAWSEVAEEVETGTVAANCARQFIFQSSIP